MSSHAKTDLALLSLSALNNLSSQVAVLDANGLILKVNPAWSAFALENNGPQSLADGVGLNYLDICQNVNGSCDEGAFDVYRGIRAVIAGEQQEFSLEYPCHSPTEQRWFLMTVIPFNETNDYVVVSHFNITQQKQVEFLRSRTQIVELFGYTPDILGCVKG